jgi:4-hydroxy-L-threonine phosphate dehydrogenase PdxA
MKTIYDRLNPEILASINKDKQEYPYTTKALKEKLKNSISWDELTVGDIRSVVIHSHISIVDIQQEDLLWGDKFLINEE